MKCTVKNVHASCCVFFTSCPCTGPHICPDFCLTSGEGDALSPSLYLNLSSYLLDINDEDGENVDVDTSTGRFVRYQFTPAFLKLRTVGATWVHKNFISSGFCSWHFNFFLFSSLFIFPCYCCSCVSSFSVFVSAAISQFFFLQLFSCWI